MPFSLVRENSGRPRLIVFLGAGGVGKTTLSASLAVALAVEGQKVGLLSIDPAKRLKTALGVGDISENGTPVNLSPLGGKGTLIAASLDIGSAMRRWVTQEGISEHARDLLFASPLFLAVADRLATATDTFAAARLAEWLQSDSKFDVVVVDTAPGLHALDFLTKPEKLAAFVDSKLADWLKWFAQGDSKNIGWVQKIVKGSAKMILDGLAQIGGQNFLVSFGHFLISLDQMFITMLKRISLSVSHLVSRDTSYVLVCAPRTDSFLVASALQKELQNLRLKVNRVILNRCLPASLVSYFKGKPEIESINNSKRDQTFLKLLENGINTETLVKAQLIEMNVPVVQVPTMARWNPGQALELSDLLQLGKELLPEANVN